MRITNISVYGQEETMAATQTYCFSVDGWGAVNELIDWADKFGLNVIEYIPASGTGEPTGWLWACQSTDTEIAQHVRVWLHSDD